MHRSHADVGSLPSPDAPPIPALTHGTIPWMLAAHERRTVLLTDAPGSIQSGRTPVPVAEPSQRSDRRRLLLEPAYADQRATVGAAG